MGDAVLIRPDRCNHTMCVQSQALNLHFLLAHNLTVLVE